MKIHIAAALIVFIASLCRNGPNELVVLVLAIALVFIAELVNTAVEAIIDLISPEEHVLARVAKDTATGAALVARCLPS